MRVIKAAILAVLLPAVAIAHAGGRDIRGTIVTVEETAVVIKSVSGALETISLVPATSYKVGTVDGQWSDMHDGLRAVVHVGHDGKAIAVHLPARK